MEPFFGDIVTDMGCLEDDYLEKSDPVWATLKRSEVHIEKLRSFYKKTTFLRMMDDRMNKRDLKAKSVIFAANDKIKVGFDRRDKVDIFFIGTRTLLMIDFDDSNPYKLTRYDFLNLIRSLSEEGYTWALHTTDRGIHAFCISHYITVNNSEVYRLMRCGASDIFYILFTMSQGWRIRIAPKASHLDDTVASVVVKFNDFFNIKPKDKRSSATATTPTTKEEEESKEESKEEEKEEEESKEENDEEEEEESREDYEDYREVVIDKEKSVKDGKMKDFEKKESTKDIKKKGVEKKDVEKEEVRKPFGSYNTETRTWIIGDPKKVLSEQATVVRVIIALSQMFVNLYSKLKVTSEWFDTVVKDEKLLKGITDGVQEILKDHKIHIPNLDIYPKGILLVESRRPELIKMPEPIFEHKMLVSSSLKHTSSPLVITPGTLKIGDFLKKAKDDMLKNVNPDKDDSMVEKSTGEISEKSSDVK